MVHVWLTRYLWWGIWAQMPLHLEAPSDLLAPRIAINDPTGPNFHGGSFGDPYSTTGTLDSLAWYELVWESYTWRWSMKEGVWVCEQLHGKEVVPLGSCGLNAGGTIEPGKCKSITLVLPRGTVRDLEGRTVLVQTDVLVRVTRPVISLSSVEGSEPKRREINRSTWVWAYHGLGG